MTKPSIVGRLFPTLEGEWGEVHFDRGTRASPSTSPTRTPCSRRADAHGKVTLGYFRHNSMIVTTHDEAKAAEGHAEARRIFGETLVTPVLNSEKNGFLSFAVMPDGSKEGWDASRIGDEKRAGFAAWLRDQWEFDWVDVRYGGDGGSAGIDGSSGYD